MPTLVSRREFLLSAAGGLVAGDALGISHPMRPLVPLPPAIRWAGRPVAIASANGLQAVRRAHALLLGGADPLDAAIEGVRLQELDPDDMSVGYGGLPNAEGVVQLDASCMHGPSKRAGGVAALEGIKTPSQVAKLVLRYTDHVLLVGEGAKRFALSHGLREENLLTERAREAWLRWRANLNPDDDWLDIPESEPLSERPGGTVTCAVVTPTGDLASVTSTSGLAWKLPGRVGDSPLVGAGQYCDNAVGAAGSTGRGEACIKACATFLTVDELRRGQRPTDACLEALRRVLHMTEPRLLDARGRPAFQLYLYAVTKEGAFGAAALYPGRYAVHDGADAAIRDTAYLHDRSR